MRFLVSSFFLLLILSRPSLSAAVPKAESHSEILSHAPNDEILYSDKFFYSATRSIQPIGRVTDSVTVITREEIDRWPVSDLDQALSWANGIVIQDTGFIGQTATAQINGSKPREVRVMVDGIPFNATTTGGIADLSQLPLDSVEKIEIIKGAASSVWGSAMGGVINIITRPVGKKIIPHGTNSVSFGAHRTQRERGEMSGSLGPLHYYGFGSHVEDGGHRANSDELENRGLLKAVLPLTEDLSFKSSFGYSGSKISEFNLPDISQTQKRKVFSRYGNAGFSHNWNDKIQSDFFYKFSERKFRREILLFPSQTFFQFSKAHSILHEASFQSVLKFTEAQSLVLGSDVAVEVYRDAVFRATSTRNDVNKESTEHAYYANYQLSWRALDVTLGSRLDATNSYGVNFDPSAGMVVHFPRVRSLFRANVARAFNAPSLVDRYLSVGSTIANPDLEAETAVVYSLGPEIEPIKGISAGASFFQNYMDNSIQTIVRSDGLRQPVNIAQERRTGFETDLKLGPWYGLSASYGTTFVHVTDGDGVPLQSRPRLTQDIKLNYAAVFYRTKLNIHLAGRHTDLVQYSGFTQPADQIFIFDGKIMLTFPTLLYGNVSLFLIGKNLTNENFSFDREHAPLPRRNFEAGVRYQF